MNTRISSLVLATLMPLAVIGCGKADNNSAEKTTTLPRLVEIDEDGEFESILNEVDKAIGKRFQSMQMGAMISATYQYDGSIDKVAEIIEPMAIKAGYSPVDNDTSQQAIADGQKHMQEMANMEIKMIESKMYQHENGNMITIMRMDISSDAPKMQMDMSMLTVQMMNPNKMSE